LTRASIISQDMRFLERMDGRVKPGHDEMARERT
jgi:hypothetical protein